MLMLSRRTNQSIILKVGDIRIEVLVAEIEAGRYGRRGGLVKLGIDAPKDTVVIYRKELEERNSKPSEPQPASEPAT